MAAATTFVVVDASLAVMWVLNETYSVRALARAAEWVRHGVELTAPCFMLTEATNAIYKRIARGQLTLQAAQTALDVLLAFDVRLDEMPDLHRRAMTLVSQLGRPSTYDAHYLALADMNNCEMWTGDERLYNAVRAQVSWVRWIGSYQPVGQGT